jgi:hypothetical protein
MPGFITPVEITPSLTGWRTVDLSSHVPAGTTGVMLHITSTGGSSYVTGWRMTGSSDDWPRYISAGSHIWASVGCDTSRSIDLNVGHVTYTNVYLVGYYGSEAVFFESAVNKSLTNLAAWTDISIASDTGANTAIAGIFEIVNQANSGSYQFGLRKEGSSDERYPYVFYHHSQIVPVDASEVCEGKISNANVDFYLNGYLKAGVSMYTNATDISLDSMGSWIDLPALPSGALGGIITVAGVFNQISGLRKNGSSESIIMFTDRGPQGLIECDASRLIEGQVDSLSIDFFLAGYFVSTGTANQKTVAGAVTPGSTIKRKLIRDLTGRF